jgi:hypothetical protein
VIAVLAYEFESVVADGTIRIPDEYRGNISASIPVKVIIVPMHKNVPDKTRLFPDLRLSTKNYRFDREEANAR